MALFLYKLFNTLKQMLTQNQKQILELQKNITKLAERKERYMYLGLMSEYQTQPDIINQKLDYTKLNPAQHFLFKRVLHGLNIYSLEERNKLHWDKKRRIKKVWQRGQREVNAWKQIICNKNANKLFEVFHNSSLAKQLFSYPIDNVDYEYVNTLSFKEIGIRYEDLILFYMNKGLLPKNFLAVK